MAAARLGNCSTHTGNRRTAFLFLLTTAALFLYNQTTLLRIRSISLDKRNVAFVYLADSSTYDVWNLNCSLKTIFENFNDEHQYRVIILHEDMSGELQRALTIRPGIEFRKVDLTLEQSLNSSYNLPSRPKYLVNTRKAVYGYRNMCRFWFSQIFKEGSPLADLKYYVRLDTDSAFPKRIRRDFIADLILRGVVYGYNFYTPDCGQKVLGLRKLVSQFAKKQLKMIENEKLWHVVQHPENGDRKCMPSYYNNFEFVNLDRFRYHPEMKRWFDVVDEDGGIYRNRWGDAPLRYLTAALFFKPSEVTKIKLSSYGHNKSLYLHGFSTRYDTKVPSTCGSANTSTSQLV